MKKLLFCAIYPESIASTRWRYNEIAKVLTDSKTIIHIDFLMGERYHYYKNNRFFYYLYIQICNLLRYVRLLRSRKSWNSVLIYNELFFMNPIPARFLFGRRGYSLDFDDIILGRYQGFRACLTLGYRKLESEIRNAKMIACGNSYIKWKISQLGIDESRLLEIPTGFKFSNERKTAVAGDKTRNPISVGWLGSASTSLYLEEVIGALNEVSSEVQIRLIIVGADKSFDFKTNFPIDFIPWSASNERYFLESIDIGIMPLHDTSWERGKCGFKLIQYAMAGKRAIGSAVGMNFELASKGLVHLAYGRHDWVDLIRILSNDVYEFGSYDDALALSARRFYDTNSLARLYLQMWDEN